MHCVSVTPAGSHLCSVYISPVYLLQMRHDASGVDWIDAIAPHPDYTCDCLTFTHNHLTGATQGGHSCPLFKEEEETCQEKIVKNRKLSWLESPSFLLASMNAASSQSFIPEDSIRITLILTTSCFVSDIQAEICTTPLLLKTQLWYKNTSTGPWAVNDGILGTPRSLRFFSGQRLHSSKTHTTPSCRKAATLSFHLKTSHITFQQHESKCRCCSLQSPHLLLVKWRTQTEAARSRENSSGLAIQHLVTAAIMHLESDCRGPVVSVRAKQSSTLPAYHFKIVV